MNNVLEINASGRRFRWLRSVPWAITAVLAAALALSTLSVAPLVWFKILPHLQPHVTRWYLGVGLVVTACLYGWAWSAGSSRRPAALLALTGLLGVYVFILFIYYRGEPPAKKFHILEYGLLSGVTLQAVRIDGWKGAGALTAALFLVTVGTADETAQAFMPIRTFRWLDLFANYIGSALGALCWIAASPESPWRRGGEAS